MMKKEKTPNPLLQENQELRNRLQEAEDTLQAIREGTIDALVVNGPHGEQVFTLTGEDQVYRHLVEAMSEAGVLTTLDGHILFCNERFGEMLGRPMEDIVGAPIDDLIHPSCRNAMAKLLNNAQAGLSRKKMIFLTLDGTSVSSRISANLLHQADAASICMVIMDLTELEASEEITRQLHEQKKAIEENTAQLRDARLAALNILEDTLAAHEQAEKLNAALEQEVKVRQHAEEELKKSHDELEMRVKIRTQELTETIEALENEAWERIVAEKAVRLGEERYRSLILATTQIVWMTDAQGLVVDDMLSWRLFTGQSVEEIQEWGWFDAIHPDDRNGTAKIWLHSIQNKSFYETEFRMRKFDGKYRDMSVRGVPVLEADGSIREWVGTCTDITEHKQAEREILHSHNKLRLLAAELQLVEEQQRRQIASDLHDSVGQILSFSVRELALLQKNSSGKTSQMIHEISNQLNDAVRQVRTLSFDLSPAILYDLGLEVALEDMIERFAGERKIQHHFENCSAPKPLTDNIKIFLYRSVRELLINAAKHAEASCINVSLFRSDGNLRVVVEDDGRGFDPDDLIDLTGRPRGFGIFNIRERLNHIGGRFEIESEKGKGTKITLIAPLHIGQERT